MSQSPEGETSLSGLSRPQSFEKSALEEEKQHATDSSKAADSDSSEDDPVYITGAPLYLVMFSITLAAGLLFLDTAIIATAIPKITDDFNSLPDVGWYGSAYQLGSAGLLPLSGKIFMHFSSKWSFLGFFAVFELGSILCGAATSSSMLIVGRAIAGAGGSGLISGALTIIATCFPLDKRAGWTGMLMGFSQLGVVLGPILGGAFTEYVSWRWCFYINLPLGGLCTVFLLFVKIPDQIKKEKALTVLLRIHHYLDLIGFVVFAAAVIQLLLALQYGSDHFGWNSSTVIGLFCGAGATFIVWFGWNWRLGDNALIPRSMVAKRPVWTSSLTQGFSMTVLFITTYFLPIYFQAVQGDSPLGSGVRLLPSIVSQTIFAVLGGALVARTGFTIPYTVFGTILAAIGSGLFSTLGPHTGIGKWFGFQILAGAGRGICMQMPIISMQAVLKPNELSMANSLMMFANSLITSITLTVSNTILDESLRSEIPVNAPAINAEAVIAVGATGFRTIVDAASLPGVILSYANSFDKVFYLAAACAVLAFLISPFMGWYDIRKKAPKPAAVDPEAAEMAVEADEKAGSAA